MCYVYTYSLNAGVKGGKDRLGKAKDGCFALLGMTSNIGGGTSFFNVSVMLSVRCFIDIDTTKLSQACQFGFKRESFTLAMIRVHLYFR